MIIYQIFPRVFGATNTKRCGTFSDISDEQIERLKSLSISHIWLTGVIRHSGWRDTNPAVTKGEAGSPYAITDYYDIDPDLAEDETKRMDEFVTLVNKIHSHGMKVIIDLIPNHLAREYHSKNKSGNVHDFGEDDDVSVKFSPKNNFYYCSGQKFIAPSSSFAEYQEFPAKASGNDVFNATPSLSDWYDTVKLNYGIDFQDGKKYFDPIPDTWRKMLNVIEFWCSKGIDGFRVDMAEMVPVEFWRWVMAEVRKSFSIIFVAEIYQPQLYQSYLDAGFDYLYDKVGLYNTLENIFRYGQSVETISNVWKNLNGLDDKMLRFMENHDEVRLASKFFMHDAKSAFPYVALAALMNRGPFMIYNGQEYGENADGANGFSGDDGRTSIFDYVFMPSFFKKDKNRDEVEEFYRNLLIFREKNDAIQKGAFYDLMWANPWYSNFDPQYVYAFLRYFCDDKLLIVINFNLKESRNVTVTIPEDARHLIGGCDAEYDVVLKPGECKILNI